MRDLLILAVHLLVTIAKLLGPGGVRAVAAESLLLKHQLQISNRSRQRAANLTSLDRVVLGLTTLFIRPSRISKLAALFKPATLLKFHKVLVDRKYRLLFSASAYRRKPGPKEPSAEVTAAIVAMKSRNPKFGYMRIAQQVSNDLGITIDKDVVRRVLEIEEAKSVPYAPISHPFVERLIGTICREYLDNVFFWNVVDVTRKLADFQTYYNAYCVHRSLDGVAPALRAGASPATPAKLDSSAWKMHCRGLFQTPTPA
jgi:hypothetical protein